MAKQAKITEKQFREISKKYGYSLNTTTGSGKYNVLMDDGNFIKLDIDDIEVGAIVNWSLLFTSYFGTRIKEPNGSLSILYFLIGRPNDTLDEYLKEILTVALRKNTILAMDTAGNRYDKAYYLENGRLIPITGFYF